MSETADSMPDFDKEDFPYIGEDGNPWGFNDGHYEIWDRKTGVAGFGKSWEEAKTDLNQALEALNEPYDPPKDNQFMKGS